MPISHNFSKYENRKIQLTIVRLPVMLKICSSLPVAEIIKERDVALKCYIMMTDNVCLLTSH